MFNYNTVIKLLLIGLVVVILTACGNKEPALSDQEQKAVDALNATQMYIENAENIEETHSTNHESTADFVRVIMADYEGPDKYMFEVLANMVEDNKLDEVKDLHESLSKDHKLE